MFSLYENSQKAKCQKYESAAHSLSLKKNWNDVNPVQLPYDRQD